MRRALSRRKAARSTPLPSSATSPRPSHFPYDSFHTFASVGAFLDEVSDPRKSPLGREPVHDGEELLQTFEALLALDAEQRFAPTLTRRVPAAGDERGF